MPATRDIQIPAESILALRRALVRQVGREAADRALQEAGHSAGDALFARLGGDAGQVGDTPLQTFWDRLAGLFRELGWGSVEHQTPHPGVGALEARDWFEVDESASRPTSPFTTGLLANLLGRAAGGEVAVLQVACEGSGARCARFLFGAPPVLDRLYSGLREGQDVDAGLAALG
jgi:predicted hydrocarbon binding protein